MKDRIMRRLLKNLLNTIVLKYVVNSGRIITEKRFRAFVSQLKKQLTFFNPSLNIKIDSIEFNGGANQSYDITFSCLIDKNIRTLTFNVLLHVQNIDDYKSHHIKPYKERNTVRKDYLKEVKDFIEK